jgi:glycosyltransferase involved in cell wall biosynthesis
MTTPLVSIVIATFNGAAYLEEQLESIITQTYPNIEIIASDDGSIDNTIEILLKYSAAHKNFTLLKNTNNLGYIKNFEQAMTVASGEYIAPCDQDDYWHPNKISLMVDAIENYPMLYSDSELVDDKLQSLGKKMSDKKNLATYTNCLVFATDNCIAGHATLLTKKLFLSAIPFPKQIPHDWWLPYVATFYGGVKYLDIPLVKYRNHAGNFIGAIKIKKTKKRILQKNARKKKDLEVIKERVKFFCEKCPDSYLKEKTVIKRIIKSYSSFSLENNWNRAALYLKYRKYFLAIKKCTVPYKYFFCIKMFFKIR